MKLASELGLWVLGIGAFVIIAVWLWRELLIHWIQ